MLYIGNDLIPRVVDVSSLFDENLMFKRVHSLRIVLTKVLHFYLG